MPLGGIYKDKDLEDFYKTGTEEEEPTETRMIVDDEPEEERKVKTTRGRSLRSGRRTGRPRAS